MTLQLTGSDWHGSPFVTLNQGATSFPKWGPFGGSFSRTGPGSPPPGFNGERQDPLTGVTHLGNGYRAYSPALRRFTCPDSESPFGVGGINPYAYCNNDPINQTDPDGHGPLTWMLRQLLKIGLRIGLREATLDGMSSTLTTTGYVETGVEFASSAATGIASQSLAKSNPEVSAKLGWASLGLGLAASLRPLADLTSRTRHGLKKLSGSKRVVILEGTMQDTQLLSNNIVAYEDLHHDRRRLNVYAHGINDNGSSFLIANNIEGEPRVDAFAVYESLKQHYRLEYFSSIRVIACHAGEGGENSFGYRLHKLTGLPVKAYIGLVFSDEDTGLIAAKLENSLEEGTLADYQNDLAFNSVLKIIKSRWTVLYRRPGAFHKYNFNPIYFGEKPKSIKK